MVLTSFQLMKPCKSSRRVPMTPSMPLPNSGVWISFAYCGLTVVTLSAKTIPPFSMHIWSKYSNASIVIMSSGRFVSAKDFRGKMP